MFKITSPAGTNNATLAFAEGPDFEKPWNKNTDQVYEVTIVVTDSVGNTDELPVTVKVINSTEDNKPGKVTLSNRVPEVNVPLKAELTDPDTAKAPISWQWYRAAFGRQHVLIRTTCPFTNTHRTMTTVCRGTRRRMSGNADTM